MSLAVADGYLHRYAPLNGSVVDLLQLPELPRLNRSQLAASAVILATSSAVSLVRPHASSNACFCGPAQVLNRNPDGKPLASTVFAALVFISAGYVSSSSI